MDSRPNDETLLLAVAERDMGAFRTLAVQDTFGDIAAWLWGIAIRRLVSGSSSRCACWPSLSRSAAEVCPGGCPVFRDPGDYGLEASRPPPCGQPHPPRRPTPFRLGRPVRSVDGT